MSLWLQFAGIGALFGLVFVLHRKARKSNFERFRTYHSRRKYKLVPVSKESGDAEPPDKTTKHESS